MANGYLKIIVNTGSEALPVTGAQAIVLSNDGETLYTLNFPAESEGLSEDLPVEAPNIEYSFEPEATALPYSTCNVRVICNGFYTNYYNGVQIFPETIALQDANMVPLPEDATRDTEVVFDIPRHNLTQKGVPREPMTDARVLQQVYIPYNITIHLGPPNSTAPNVTKTFPRYIKNVASSEIYPTWPTNSLQANIYAQISLALNRIYTEWYRSRHYEFDITSSTAYDQNFIRGRNIFENISQLVDEVFNVYIIKPGRQEPFYAEYCNGSTVTCPGMSQWGTVSLAQQGYSPQAILEYYYGPVELITTDDIQEIEGSYPGYPLKLGSTGRWVQIKQFGMNRISVNYPAIPKVPVDGYYGPEMEAAVRAFQRIFSLDVDGVMGKATWYRTSYIYVAITKLAELTSEGHNPIFSEGSYPGYPLKIGSTGEPVRQAQFYLSMVDTYYDLIPPVTIDGIFGSETKNVVIQFQRLYGLTDDGIIGPVTWAQLVDVYLGIEENVFVPVAVLPLKDYPGYPIKPNASGTDVVYIQLILNRISTQFPTIPPITVDGKFGNATKEAVIAFQNLFGLAADGIVGPLTWNRMNDIYSTVSSGCISITGAGEKAYPGTVVKQGQSGPNVQYIQNSLNTIRTVFPQIPSLVVDSIFGASTKTAVETFQRITGLTVDGVVGENTWNRMNDYTTAVSNGCLSDWKIYTDISDHDFIPGQDEKVSSTDNRTQEIFSVYQRPQRILKIGCFGEDVKALKILLQSTAGENPFLMGENMFFGLSTKHAVQRFQRHLGMRADGIVTSELWDKLTEV